MILAQKDFFSPNKVKKKGIERELPMNHTLYRPYREPQYLSAVKADLFIMLFIMLDNQLNK